MRVSPLAALLVLASCPWLVACGGDDDRRSKPPPQPKSACPAPDDLTPITRSLLRRVELDGDAWKTLQLYSGQRLLLRREAGRKDVQITKTRHLRMVDDKKLQEIELPCHTKGILEDVKLGKVGGSDEEAASHFHVRFEPDVPDATLHFSDERTREPLCLIKERTKEGGRVVTYGEDTYRVVGGRTCLMVKTEKVEELDKKTRVLPGAVLADAE